MIDSQPRFIQGVYAFTGAGFDHPVTLAGYTIAADKRAQPIYFRAGNSADALINLTLSCDGATMRLFPIGAKASSHVQFAVVDDISPDSRLDIAIAAPDGVTGFVVLDIGLLEI